MEGRPRQQGTQRCPHGLLDEQINRPSRHLWGTTWFHRDGNYSHQQTNKSAQKSKEGQPLGKKNLTAAIPGSSGWNVASRRSPHHASWLPRKRQATGSESPDWTAPQDTRRYAVLGLPILPMILPRWPSSSVILLGWLAEDKDRRVSSAHFPLGLVPAPDAGQSLWATDWSSLAPS